MYIKITQSGHIMKYIRYIMVLFCFSPLISDYATAQENVYWDVVQQIREEGFERSQVMETASYLTDVFGPRLAHSPSYNAAAEWAKERLEEFGLENVHFETWGEFGLGWENTYTSVHMIEPRYMPIIAYPNPWTSGTNGKIRAPVMLIDVGSMKSEAELEDYRNNVRNSIIFTAPERKMELNFTPDAERYSKADLDELAKTLIDTPGGGFDTNDYINHETKSQTLSRTRVMQYLREEGAAVFVSPDNDGDDGTVYVYGWPLRKRDSAKPLPMVTIAAEHYNRIVRILQKNIPVEMEIEIKSTFYDENLEDFNVIAEIPGTDLADELVILGGHFDATSTGTGATDNGAGSSVVIEAVRILKEISVQPRRTIRAMLWGAEELGAWGSRGYAAKHFGNRNTMELKPDHENVSVYFNYDNGTGKIRGIYLQNNPLVRPIFDAWMKPFHDLGATHLAPGNTGGTDHLAFDEIGLPGFQFIQDPLEYDSRTHHSNMDVFDRLSAEDLMQASVVMASFVYHASMRDEKLPRKSLPEPRIRN